MRAVFREVRIRARASVLLVLTLGGACREQPRDIREWTPADHQQESPADDGRAAPPEVDPNPEETERRVAGALFGQLCAGCHGQEGRGDGPSRPPIARVPDLTDPAWQSSRDDDAIASVIREGRNMMPAFAAQLSPDGVAALVRHVRRMGDASNEEEP